MFSQADAEYSEDFDINMALIYGATHFVSKTPQSNSFLIEAGSFEVINPTYAGTHYVYDVDWNAMLLEWNLEYRGTLEVVDSKGKPVYRTTCILSGDDWTIDQVSDKAGEILFLVPAGRSFAQVKCEALGFSTSYLSGNKIEMTFVGLFHKTNSIRY
ncbi:MAG: hypothetical protein GOV00_01135 [Candidatus Altiarchaeota archaeon]|nr:hypothetical protein [Candidatus Altiarchaeota archaeon]